MRPAAWLLVATLPAGAAELPPPREVVALVRAGRLPEAEAALRAGIAAGREGPAVGFLLGEVLRRQSKFAEAEPFLLRAVAARPERAAWRHALAIVQREQGRCAAAVETLAHAIALDPRPAYRYDRAMCALDVGRFDLAEEELAQVLASDADHLPARLALAIRHADRGQDAAARALLTQVVARERAPVEARFRLALLDLAGGEPAAARAGFERVLAEAPAHVGATQGLARACTALGRTDEARRVLAQLPARHAEQERLENRLQAIQLQPRDGETRQQAARLLVRMGRLDEARDQLLAASAIAPGDPTLRAALTEVERLLGVGGARP